MENEVPVSTKTLLLLPILLIISGYFYIVSESPLAFSLYALGIVGIIFFTVRPTWGFYLMALMAPMIGPSFFIQGLIFTPIDLLAFLVLVGFYIRVILSTFFSKKPQRLIFPYFLYFFIFFISILISNLLNEGAFASLWYAFRLILFFYLAYFSLGVSLIKDEKILKTSIYCLSVSGLVVAMCGLLSLLGQDITNNFFRVQGLEIFGKYPFGENHNLIAEYLVIANFFVIAAKFWIKSISGQRMINIIFVLMFIITIATFSRAGWIVSGLQLALFVILAKKNKFKKILLCFALLSLSIPVFIRMEQLQQENYSSTEHRILLSQLAWKSFLEKPFFGEGTGKFTKVVGQNIRYTANYGVAVDSHGVWQKLILENGAVGTISFGLIIISFSIFLFRVLGRAREYYDLLLPLIVASLGGIVYQFFNTSYYLGKLWIPLAITMAAALFIKNQLYESAKN